MERRGLLAWSSIHKAEHPEVQAPALLARRSGRSAPCARPADQCTLEERSVALPS